MNEKVEEVKKKKLHASKQAKSMDRIDVEPQKSSGNK